MLMFNKSAIIVKNDNLWKYDTDKYRYTKSRYLKVGIFISQSSAQGFYSLFGKYDQEYITWWLDILYESHDMQFIQANSE